MTFKAEIAASLGWNWDEGAVDNDRLDYAKQLLLGSGDDQAEAVWHAKSQTLLEGASVALDLSALSRSVLGDLNTVTFLTVKAVLIINEGTAGGRLLVGGAGADEWSAPFGADGDQVTVPLDSTLLLSNRRDGWPVDYANRNLKLAAVGGSVTYSIAVVGTTSVAGSGSSGG